jgi:uncharacterized protein (DUF2147 family)
MPRLHKAFHAVLLFLCASLAGGAVASAAGPRGVWLRGDGNARVEFAPCDDKLCATNLWIRDSSSGEEVGDKLIMTLQPKSSTTLVGTAYDRKRDRTYSLTITLGDGAMTTRGCIIAGLLCKQVTWTPVAQASR